MTARLKRDVKRFVLLAGLGLFSVGVAFSACSDSTSPDADERERELRERELET